MGTQLIGPSKYKDLCHTATLLFLKNRNVHIFIFFNETKYQAKSNSFFERKAYFINYKYKTFTKEQKELYINKLMASNSVLISICFNI